MSQQQKKLELIKAKYSHWNKGKKRSSRDTSDCEGCSSSSGDGCHGDGSCGGDGS